VDHHLSSILNKLGVENRAHAVATAVRDGLF
jgi:DNA-binding NarL/FixJ family response regulator